MVEAQDGRVPPYSAEAERAVLGAVLLDNGALARAQALMGGGDFYLEIHRLIWAAMERLLQGGTAVDAVSLGQSLREMGKWDQVGGTTTLAQLTDAVVSAINVEHHAAIVARAAARRAVIFAAQEIAARGYATADDDTDNYLADAEAAMLGAARLRSTAGAGPRLISEELPEALRALREGIPKEVVPTGLPAYDRFYGGLWPGLVHVIGGRPAMGKSCLALNLATNAARGGRKVLYICLEDTRRQTVLRLLARFAGQSLRTLSLGRLADDRWDAVLGATSVIQDLPLWVDDTAGMTSAAIARVARRHQATVGLDLLIVDHIGDVADTGKSDTEIQSRAAVVLRDVIKVLNVPGILLVQLNRGVESRPDKRPKESDLRQSGVLEQVARFILFPYRGGYYSGEHGRRDLELIVAKATNFPVSTQRCWVDLSQMYVRDWEPADGAWTGEMEAGKESNAAGRFAQSADDTSY
jgi:replicative DNA helicase